MKLKPKNWEAHQHYRTRNPPWIKLHKRLLDDFEFQALPLASRALAPMLWLMASESKDGAFDADPKLIAFRLRANAKEVETALTPLIDSGFFECLQDASKPLATQLHDATSEKTETETETDKRVASAPPLVLIPATKGEVPVTQPMVDEWKTAFPAVDVMQEVREMRAWCLANPDKRKTPRGVPAFAVRWLSKAQDRGGHSAAKPSMPSFD